MDQCQAAVLQYVDTQKNHCSFSLISKLSGTLVSSANIIQACSDSCANAERQALTAVQSACTDPNLVYALDGANIPVSTILSTAGTSQQAPECTVLSSDGVNTCLASIANGLSSQCTDEQNSGAGRACTATEQKQMICGNSPCVQQLYTLSPNSQQVAALYQAISYLCPATGRMVTAESAMMRSSNSTLLTSNIKDDILADNEGNNTASMGLATSIKSLNDPIFTKSQSKSSMGHSLQSPNFIQVLMLSFIVNMIIMKSWFV